MKAIVYHEYGSPEFSEARRFQGGRLAMTKSTYMELWSGWTESPASPKRRRGQPVPIDGIVLVKPGR